MDKSFKKSFKEPLPVKKASSSTHKKENRSDRINQLNQLRQNKLNTSVLLKKGIIDKDGESTIPNISATNLTALIDYSEGVRSPILVVLMALNAEADVNGVALRLTNALTITKNYSLISGLRGKGLSTGIVPGDIVKGKPRLTVVASDRAIHSCLDYSKVADLIIFVSSSKGKHDCKLLKKDPLEAVTAIDERGYEIISAINSQGMLNHVVLIDNLEVIEDKYKSGFKKLTTRYIESVLKPLKIIYSESISEKVDIGTEVSVETTDDIKSIIRTVCLANYQIETHNLRRHRSYMLVDTFLKDDKDNLVVKGYIKGNTLNNHNYIHLTGFGDYQVLEVDDEENDPCPLIKQSSSTKMLKDPTTTEVESIEATGKQIPTIIGDEFKKQKIIKQEQQKVNNLLDQDLEELIDFKIDPEDDISFEAADYDEKQQTVDIGKSNKHEAKTSLQYRKPDEMEVPDEVDTPVGVSCREVFSKYRGLSSMKPGSMDPSVNLPREYSSIYSFENMAFTYKESVKAAHEHGLKISGKYIKVTLRNFKEFHLLDQEKPLIFSTLLNHERKLCVMHLKVMLRESCEEPQSKQLVECQIGFRRNLTRPLYSSIIGDTDKLKKEKSLIKGRFVIATIYAQLTYSEIPVLMLNLVDNELKLIADGKTLPSDCNKIVLKRIVLTGYPLKIHKKTSVVRYMFFTPEDVNYFKPVPLFTKLGLRGNIVESLGTHGYMKCSFSDTLRANDTVCMALYKRCFPVWFPETWRLPLGYSNSTSYIEMLDKETRERKEKLLLESAQQPSMVIDN